MSTTCGQGVSVPGAGAVPGALLQFHKPTSTELQQLRPRLQNKPGGYSLPQPSGSDPSLGYPSSVPVPLPAATPHRDLTYPSDTESFSGRNGLTRKCSREGEATSGRKEYFRGSRSGSSAAVAAVRMATGVVRGFPGGGWSGAGSRGRTAGPGSPGSGEDGLRQWGGHLAAGR